MTQPPPHDRLSQLEHTIAALGAGQIDGIVVGAPGEERVLTLTGAELPYRAVITHLLDGVATLQRDGTILFANPQLARLLQASRADLMGESLATFVDPSSNDQFEELLAVGVDMTHRAEVSVRAGNENTRLLVGTTAVTVGGLDVVCAVLADLTEQRRLESQLASERRRAEIKMDRLAMAQRVNDAIVQDIVVAEMALGLGDVERAKGALARTSKRARVLIGQLTDGELTPGAAVLVHEPTGGDDDV